MKNYKFKSYFKYISVNILIAALIVLFLNNYIVSAAKIKGNSMQPSLKSKDRVLISKFLIKSNNIKRFDIIVFNNPREPKISIIKRVIGLPNEIIKIENGNVYINNTLLKQTFLFKEKLFLKKSLNIKALKIPENHFFVLGDNRNNSKDSRTFGLVPDKNIYQMKKSVLIIITTYLTIIVIGALLLMLPISTQTGSIKPENALFTSASAITVTGLIVVDTSTYFTFFGQLVILILLQCGGLGFMLFSTLIILLVGKSISLKDKVIIENDFTTGTYKSIKGLIKKVFLLTFGFELIGSIILFFQFSNMTLKTRIFSSIFHSISAFCNAGFSTFSNSLENHINNPGINITFAVLIISGGLGFLVLNELFSFIKIKNKHFSKISLHSKLVIITSITLIIVGFLIIFIEEILNKSNTLSNNSKILSALFQSITARTAGFNTINLNLLSYASIFFILILMFIGASPGSTGGGIKTSSARKGLFSNNNFINTNFGFLFTFTIL